MIKKHLIPSLVFIGASLLVALPVLLHSGQIFLLDMIFPPTLNAASLSLERYGGMLPMMTVMTLLAKLFSVAVVMKILMMTVLLLPMFAMYLLLAGETKRMYATLGGLLFLFNPFMYERFVAGHWFVMLGLAYLPIVFYFLRRTLATYSYRHTALFALLFSLYPMISVHFAYIGMGLVVLYTLVHTATRKREHIFSKKYAKHGTLFLGILILVNSFWIEGFLSEGSTFRAIDERDFRTFVTQSDSTLGVYGNVLTLHGFWRESSVLPKDVLPMWYVPSFIILLFALIGLVVRIKKRDKLAVTLLLAAPPMLLLAVGYGAPFTEALTRLTLHYLPGFSGLRETAKLVGIFAFAYAYLAPIGLEALTHQFYGQHRHAHRIGVLALIICGLATSFTFLWGAVGQVAQAEYPKSWGEANAVLEREAHGKVLVFPWRGYLEMNFADNVFIANPAKGYFAFPVETAESINSVAYDSKYTTAYDELIPIDKNPDDIARDLLALKKMGVTHVILLKTSDWERYLKLVHDERYFTQEYDREAAAVYRLK